MTKIYKLFADKHGNPIILQGSEDISIKVAGQEGVEITEAEALSIMGQQSNS